MPGRNTATGRPNRSCASRSSTSLAHLLIAVAVGVAVIDGTRGHGPADIGVLVDDQVPPPATRRLWRRSRIRFSRSVSASRISSAVPRDIGREQLAVGQHVVDVRAGWTIRSTLSASRAKSRVEPEARRAEIAGEHLEAFVGQSAEALPAAPDRCRAPISMRCRASARHRRRGPGRSACRPTPASRSSHSRAEEPAEETGRAGQQHRAIVRGGGASRRGGLQDVRRR